MDEHALALMGFRDIHDRTPRSQRSEWHSGSFDV
jgi:hypothetical protein